MSAEAANNKGRSPLHEFARWTLLFNIEGVLGGESIWFWFRFTEKNAVEMLELFLECMPEYNIDRPDGEGKLNIVNRCEYAETGLAFLWCFVSGNTPLLLAYTKGNGDLCRALVI